LADFYDELAPDLSGLANSRSARQGEQLSALIGSEWPASRRRLLDVACGIGTQAIGLAPQGFRWRVLPAGAGRHTAAVAPVGTH
jgi:2-polyprenyl-3-methyl-5-hydroxy-6-metoxy-1,4-benzoquinol methylase